MKTSIRVWTAIGMLGAATGFADNVYQVANGHLWYSALALLNVVVFGVNKAMFHLAESVVARGCLTFTCGECLVCVGYDREMTKGARR